MAEHERRKSDSRIHELQKDVALLKAADWHSDNHWKEVKVFMAETKSALSLINTQLALISRDQKDDDDYQEGCGKDRETIKTRVENIEKYQFKVGTTSALFGAAMGAVIEWFIKK